MLTTVGRAAFAALVTIVALHVSACGSEPPKAPVLTPPTTTRPPGVDPGVLPTDPTQPGMPPASAQPSAQPGATQPGATQPGAAQPAAHPGATQPNNSQPNNTNPNNTNPNNTNPNNTNPNTGTNNQNADVSVVVTISEADLKALNP